MFPDNDPKFDAALDAVKNAPASMIVCDALIALRATASACGAIRVAATPDSALHKACDDIERVLHALVVNQFAPLTELVTKETMKAVKDYA